MKTYREHQLEDIMMYSFATWLLNKLADTKTPAATFMDDLCVTPQRFYNWVNRVTLPRQSMIDDIIGYFEYKEESK